MAVTIELSSRRFEELQSIENDWCGKVLDADIQKASNNGISLWIQISTDRYLTRYLYIDLSDPEFKIMACLQRMLEQKKVEIRLSKLSYKAGIWVDVRSVNGGPGFGFLVEEKVADKTNPATNLGQLLKEKLEARPTEFGAPLEFKLPVWPLPKVRNDFLSTNPCQEIPLPMGSAFWDPEEIDMFHKSPNGIGVNPSTLVKEKSMSNTLIKLADVNLQKELAQVGLTTNAGLKAALEAEIQTRADNANKEAAKEIIKVLESADSSIENNVDLIRYSRSVEKRAKEHIEKVKRAKAYGLSASNFFPLAILLCKMGPHSLTSDQKHLAEIPADFKADETNPEVKASA